MYFISLSKYTDDEMIIPLVGKFEAVVYNVKPNSILHNIASKWVYAMWEKAAVYLIHLSKLG